MKRIARLSFAVASLINVATCVIAQQFADPGFDPTVDRPAFTDTHPVVLIDEAHNNFHTAGGRYKPFADLVTSDGYTVTPNTKKFTADALKGCAILVVANAQGAPLMKSAEAANAAFEPAECDAVHDWVKAGGSLLLIADHHPWGKSNEPLATRLGLDMGKSTAFDPANSETRIASATEFLTRQQVAGRPPHPRGTRRLRADRPHPHFRRAVAQRAYGCDRAAQVVAICRRPASAGDPGS